MSDVNNESEPTRDELTEELKRVLSSPDFASSEQLTQFLTFVVNETLDGRAAMLKERNIAIGALGRTTQFDPRVDSIVRVVAGKLRRNIELYYARAGADNPIRIEMPRGSYKPEFHRVPTQNGDRTHETDEALNTGLASEHPTEDIRLKRRNYVTVAIAFVVLISASLTTWLQVAGSARQAGRWEVLPADLVLKPDQVPDVDSAVASDSESAAALEVDADPALTMCVGALPYRITDGTVEILIVRTRRDSHWTIPKARFATDTSMWNIAQIEAFEEAGVRGEVQRSVLGQYVFERGGSMMCVVVFPLEVKQVHEIWPEDSRARRWCDQKTAAELTCSEDLSDLIKYFQPE